MSRSLGLCLGAGGSRGVAHVGFLKALEEESIVPDYISGCSMGAVVGAAYASGMNADALRDAVYALKMSDLVSLDMRMLKNNGMFKTEKMKNLLSEYLGDITFDKLKIPFKCVATDILKGKQVVFDSGSVVDAVVASSSIPSVFQPSLLDSGEYMLDGGIIDRVPVSVVKDMGADIVVAVDVIASLKIEDEPKNIIDLMFRIFGIMDTNRTEQLKKDRARLIDLWLEPELENMSQYSIKEISFAYDKGYECGRRNTDKIKKLLKIR